MDRRNHRVIIISRTRRPYTTEYHDRVGQILQNPSCSKISTIVDHTAAVLTPRSRFRNSGSGSGSQTNSKLQLDLAGDFYFGFSGGV